MFPYDSHFLCEKNADYGHCTSVQGAYQDAVGGSNANAAAGDVEAGRKDEHMQHSDSEAMAEGQGPSVDGAEALPAEKHADGHPRVVPVTARDQYKNSEYRAMAGMMDAPVAPVLAPAKVLRTLIVAYQDGQTLFMPRYVFYVVGEPHFVMGDYLSRAPAGSPSIFPNGPQRSSMGDR